MVITELNPEQNNQTTMTTWSNCTNCTDSVRINSSDYLLDAYVLLKKESKCHLCLVHLAPVGQVQRVGAEEDDKTQ